MKTYRPLKAKTNLKQKSPLKAKESLKVKTKLSKQPKSPIGKLRRNADKWFSRYVRLRDSEWGHTDKLGWGWYGQCITCTKNGLVAYIDDDSKLRFVRGWDLGHFVSRGRFSTRYSEENCNLQCSFRCNKMRSGEYIKYKAALRLKYGDKVPEELEALGETSMTLKRKDFEQITADSKEYVKEYVDYAKKNR